MNSLDSPILLPKQQLEKGGEEETRNVKMGRGRQTNVSMGLDISNKSAASDDNNSRVTQMNDEELYHKQRRKQYVSPSKLEAGLAFNAGLGFLDNSNDNLTFSPTTRRRFKRLQPFNYDSEDYSTFIPLPKGNRQSLQKEKENESSLKKKKRR